MDCFCKLSGKWDYKHLVSHTLSRFVSVLRNAYYFISVYNDVEVGFIKLSGLRLTTGQNGPRHDGFGLSNNTTCTGHL